MNDQVENLFENDLDASERIRSEATNTDTEMDNQTHQVGSDQSANEEPTEFLTWESPSRVYDAKSPQWFLGVFFIGLLLVIGLIILKEITLALVIIAAIFVFYAMARVEPGVIQHKILSSGIETADRLFEWKDLHSFWIYQTKGVIVLRLDTRLYLPHVVELLLPDETPEEDIEELVGLLKEYLPMEEKPHSEAGMVADDLILSVSNKLPGQQKMLDWLARNLGIK